MARRHSSNCLFTSRHAHKMETVRLRQHSVNARTAPSQVFMAAVFILSMVRCGHVNDCAYGASLVVIVELHCASQNGQIYFFVTMCKHTVITHLRMCVCACPLSHNSRGKAIYDSSNAWRTMHSYHSECPQALHPLDHQITIDVHDPRELK